MSKIDDMIELTIAEDIKTIIRNEITGIRAKTQLDPADILKLEKLAKTYATMMADLRENLKSGLYGKLTGESLDAFNDTEKVVEGTKEGAKRPRNKKAPLNDPNG